MAAARQLSYYNRDEAFAKQHNIPVKVFINAKGALTEIYSDLFQMYIKREHFMTSSDLDVLSKIQNNNFQAIANYCIKENEKLYITRILEFLVTSPMKSTLNYQELFNNIHTNTPYGIIRILSKGPVGLIKQTTIPDALIHYKMK